MSPSATPLSCTWALRYSSFLPRARPILASTVRSDRPCPHARVSRSARHHIVHTCEQMAAPGTKPSALSVKMRSTVSIGKSTSPGASAVAWRPAARISAESSTLCSIRRKGHQSSARKVVADKSAHAWRTVADRISQLHRGRWHQ